MIGKKTAAKLLALLFLLATVLPLCACGAQQETTATYRVAMAVADITPDRDVYLQGYESEGPKSMANYPQDFTSDIQARILIVDNGEDRMVFLSMEIISSSAEAGDHNLSVESVDAIAKICGTTREKVMLSNSHSHQSYMHLTLREEKSIVEAVKEASQRLVPAKVGVTQACTQFGISRGSDYSIDKTMPYDSLMDVIRFDNALTGEPIGCIYAVPMHNTMFGNGTEVNHDKLSCEFTGYASRAVEAAMADQNPNFVAMHVNGFYGNAGPYIDGRWRAGTPEKLQENGAAFGAEILEIFNNTETVPAIGTIKTSSAKGTLPIRTDYQGNFGALEEMPLVVTLGAFGDIGYVGVNYEPYSVMAARLKAESPYKVLMPASIVNGWKGYIPTAEAVALHESGDYQAECGHDKTPFDETAEARFYDQVLEAVCNMADVSLTRVSATAGAAKVQEGSAVYTFAMSEKAELDKLVISFGQQARTDCAMDFTVQALDGGGKEVWSHSYTDNTTNYRGEFVDGAEVATVILTVSTRFDKDMQPTTDGIDQLPVQIWGIQFENQ